MNEVSGRVTVAGKPADRLIMTLTPLVPGEGREDECVVTRGEYRARVVAGRYRVSFSGLSGGTVVPPRYRSAAASNLELDATNPDETNFALN